MNHADRDETAWSKDRIEELLRTEDFRYQNIALPHGLSTGGHDRSATAAKIFPEDLRGKSVLDLGCSFGYFCFEAIRRGAERVVGYDVDPDSIRKARLLASCLGAEVTFEQRDIERQPITERFDYVLCLNLLHHLKNPLAALDNLIAITDDRLVLEVASLGRRDRRKVQVSPVAHRILSRLPVIFVTRSGTRGRRQIQKFFITPSALENLLIHHRGMFARLDVTPSEHKDRCITIAHKRRIGHLLVVSGPTSAGKKTLMRKLLANELPELAARLGTPDGSLWGPPLNAEKIAEPSDPVRPRLMLHHDLMRPYLRSAMVHERDEALDILDTAERITFVTVWTPPARLVQQITEAAITPKMKPWSWRKPVRHLKIRALYEQPGKVVEHYRRWFDYTATRSADHVVVSLEGGLRLRSIEEWERLVRDSPGPCR